MKELKKLCDLAQEIAVRRWPPVTPPLPTQDFIIGHLPDGSPVIWPSGHLDDPDAWICVTVGTFTVDLVEVDNGVLINAEWDASGIENAVRFASRVAANLEEARQARLRADRDGVEELERQADMLFFSGLVQPNWRPGFNLLAPAVWGLSRLAGPWAGDDVRRAVFAALGMGQIPFHSVTIRSDYKGRLSDTSFGLAHGLYAQFLGDWDSKQVSASLLLGDFTDNTIHDFSQDILYNIVAQTCGFAHEVIQLADTATILLRLLGGAEW